MMNPSTMLEAMRHAAAHSAGAGVRFYDSPDESRWSSYRELDRVARHDATLLQDAGWKPGDRALLMFDAGVDFLRALYAAFYAGLTVVPVPVAVSRNADLTRERILAVAEDSGSLLALTTPQTLESIGGLDMKLTAWHLSSVVEDDRAETWTDPGTVPGDIAVIQYTSGSTGDPKGVVVSHGNFAANQRGTISATGFNPETVFLGWLPHYHDMGLGLYMVSIYGGFNLVLTSPGQFLRRPILWLRLITQHHATATAAPDFAYNLCAQLVTEEQLRGLDLSSLTTVITGAEPVHWRTLQRFSDRFAPAGFDADAFVPTFGMAEATLLVTAKRPGDPVRPLVVDATDMERGVVSAAGGGKSLTLVSCGPPPAHHHVEIADPETKTRAAPNTVGEIWLSGPSVAHGYWDKPGSTAEVFGARLPGDAREYLRTGDLGFLADGELVVTGRLKDLIIVRGRNVAPSDVEIACNDALATSANLLSAAFEWDDDAVVVVAEVDGRRLTGVTQRAEAARQEVADAFSLEPLSLILVRRGAVPRTTSGKVQRNATRERLVAGELPIIATAGPAVAGADAPIEQVV